MFFSQQNTEIPVIIPKLEHVVTMGNMSNTKKRYGSTHRSYTPLQYFVTKLKPTSLITQYPTDRLFDYGIQESSRCPIETLFFIQVVDTLKEFYETYN